MKSTKPTRPKTPRSTVTGRGRIMWAITDGTATTPCDYKGEYQFCDRKSEAKSKARYNDKPTPVAVFDMSPGASAARVEAVARELSRMEGGSWKPLPKSVKDEFLGQSIRLLASIFPAHPTDKKGAK